MQMIPRGRNFNLIIDSKDLARGLRPSKRTPRNSGYLIQSSGAVGRDGVLQVLESLETMDLTSITDGFPFPQIFVFPHVIIVCGKTAIYEWLSDALVHKLDVEAGSTWDAIASGDYVYLSNGKVSVVKEPNTSQFALSTLPVASCICNFNGQVLIGAPDEDSST